MCEFLGNPIHVDEQLRANPDDLVSLLHAGRLSREGAKQLPEELVARLEAVEPIRDSAFRLARAIQ